MASDGEAAAVAVAEDGDRIEAHDDSTTADVVDAKEDKNEKNEETTKENGDEEPDETDIPSRTRPLAGELDMVAQDDGSWQAVFVIDGKRHKVNVNDTRIVYWPDRAKTDKRTGSVRAVESHEKVLMSTILGAKPKLRKIPKSREVEPVGFTVFSINTKKRKWRERRIHFDCADIQANRRWSSRIEVTAKSSTPRPRRLKIFINPAAGKKRGIRIFHEEVLRVFSIAEIRMERDDVTVTERPGHIAAVLKEIDLDCYDGVVVVGGDGSVNELIDGLLRVTCLGVTPDFVNRCDFRIGIIPTGTHNTIASSVYGTVDPLTSALQILLGKSHNIDVMSISKTNKILRFGIDLGYGFPAEIIFQAKKHTWFGKVGLSALPAVRHHKRYPCEVYYLAVEEEKESVSSEGDTEATRTVANWRAVKGTVAGVNVASLCMASDAHPDGLWSGVKDSDGLGKLAIIEECQRTQLINYNMRFTRSGKKPDEFDFVSSHRVRAVRLRPYMEKKSKETEDGDNASSSPPPPAAASPPTIVIEESSTAAAAAAAADDDGDEKPEKERESSPAAVRFEIDEAAEDPSALTPAASIRGTSPSSVASDDALLSRQQRQPRRGLGVSLRQRLATFSVRGSRPRRHTIKEIRTTAAGDTLVRKQAARASMPLPPGGPMTHFDESGVDEEDKSIWAVDGEPVREAFVDIRIHSNLIRVFGRGDDQST